MNRRTLLCGLTLGSLSAPLAVEAHAFEEAFSQALRELGWIEGRSIAFEYRWGAGQLDRLPALAEGLVRSNVDLIVTSNWRVARAAADRAQRCVDGRGVTWPQRPQVRWASEP